MSLYPAHTIRVQRLYRASLKTLLNWAIHRNDWIVEACDMRKEFEAKRYLKDSRTIERVTSAAEAKLKDYAHPDPFTRELVTSWTMTRVFHVSLVCGHRVQIPPTLEETNTCAIPTTERGSLQLSARSHPGFNEISVLETMARATRITLATDFLDAPHDADLGIPSLYGFLCLTIWAFLCAWWTNPSM